MTSVEHTGQSTAIPTTAGQASTIRLRLLGPDGEERIQAFSVTSADEAIRRATSRGQVVLGIEPDSRQSEARGHKGRRNFPLLLFSQELLALLDAGLNLTEALATLHTKEQQPLAAEVLGQVLQALREGRNFSDVLGSLSKHFPEVYVATIRASERTGDLPRALARYITYQLQFEAIRKKLISASIYPVMLLAVGGFVMLFLLGYVVPRFSAVYQSSGRELPWLSSIMLVIGKIIYDNWLLAFLAIVSSLAGFGWLLAQPARRQRLLDAVLRLPWLAVKSEEFRLSRFYRAVSLLLSAGISLPRAMGMVSGLLSMAQQEKLRIAKQAVEHGQSLSLALGSAHLASPVADSLIKVGERSGQLAEMLERAARFHDEDFARWVDWASKLLEPMLMTIIGLVIGVVVVLMYLPIFELAGGLQ
ncbi:MAG: type II secretion system F family protein [Azoarcus sp.]|jgi:general secretion pathway protein F|nr:type II secretion system F family protein [Azoarcus sp.]